MSGVDHAVRTMVEAGVSICVASNTPPYAIEHRLKLTGHLHWFERRPFSGMTVPRPKPAPDVFLHAAATMDYPPYQCVVIEDSGARVRAGLAAGMRVLAYTGGADGYTGDMTGVETLSSMSSLPKMLGL